MMDPRAPLSVALGKDRRYIPIFSNLKYIKNTGSKTKPYWIINLEKPEPVHICKAIENLHEVEKLKSLKKKARKIEKDITLHAYMAGKSMSWPKIEAQKIEIEKETIENSEKMKKNLLKNQK